MRASGTSLPDCSRVLTWVNLGADDVIRSDGGAIWGGGHTVHQNNVRGAVARGGSVLFGAGELVWQQVINVVHHFTPGGTSTRRRGIGAGISRSVLLGLLPETVRSASAVERVVAARLRH